MRFFRRFAIATLLAGTAMVLPAVTLAPPPARAEGPTLAGYWEGTVSLPTGQLPVMIELESGQPEGWSGTIDIPIQGIRDLALSEISFDGTAVLIKVPEMPGNPVFNGSLREDGQSISGNFVQGQGVFPFTLERKPEPASHEDLATLYAPWLQPGTPGDGLAGTWRGMIDLGPARLRLNLDVTKGEDGALAATVDSVDQQAIGLPASIALGGEDGRTVTLSMPLVGASYEGAMSSDGAEISGTWKQGGTGVELTLRRAGS